MSSSTGCRTGRRGCNKLRNATVKQQLPFPTDAATWVHQKRYVGSCVHSKGQWVAGTEMLLRFQSCEKKQKHQNIISGQALMNSSSVFPSPWQQANAAWPAWIQGTAASTGTVQGCADAERDSGTDGHAPAGSASHAGAGKEREGSPAAEEGAAEKVIPRDSKGTPPVFPASNPSHIRELCYVAERFLIALLHRVAQSFRTLGGRSGISPQLPSGDFAMPTKDH